MRHIRANVALVGLWRVCTRALLLLDTSREAILHDPAPLSIEERGLRTAPDVL